MLHPVGKLPDAVYWRRRALVLTVVLALLAGAGWLTVSLLSRSGAGATDAAATTTARRTTQPALERVVPSLAAVRTPVAALRTPAVETRAPKQKPTPKPTPAPAGPAPGSRCTDDMVSLEARAPRTVDSGSKPTFELVVTNTSAVMCVRTLDQELQELVLLDRTGERIWGSNDCFPETSDDRRRLEPGEPVTFPLVWSGLTSEPTCEAARVAPPAGNYVLRGRLYTKTSTGASVRIT